MADCVRELGQPQYALPAERIEAIQAVQTGILTREAAMFEVRAQEDRIVDGHGDLRPEHICLEAEPVIIDILRDQNSSDGCDVGGGGSLTRTCLE